MKLISQEELDQLKKTLKKLKKDELIECVISATRATVAATQLLDPEAEYWEGSEFHFVMEALITITKHYEEENAES